MYFTKFPKTYYTLDNRKTVQIVTNILARVIFTDEVKNNFSAYDEYDIEDGDTPEILAYKLYGDSNLHWIILCLNDILDPRFEWPLDTYTLTKFVENKYASINGVHHYEDGSNLTVNGNVILFSSSGFTNFSTNDVVVNNTNVGTGSIVYKANANMITVLVSDGGFISGDSVKLSTNSSVNCNITSSIVLTGVPITNYIYEDQQNETRRRIKVLKSQYIQQVIKEFESQMNQLNG